jgi:hypothetical protein
MEFKSFMEALKGKQHKIDKNKNGKIDAHDFKLLRKEEVEELDEGVDPSEVAGNPKMYDAATVKKAYYHKSATPQDKKTLERHLDRHHGINNWRKPVKEETIAEATVKTDKYSWGTMKTVHHGKDFSIPLHPEHHEAIAKLKDQQEHKFKDETGRHWTAKRSGDDVHFHSANDGPKTTVKHSTMSEEVEQIDELSKGTLASYAKKATTDAVIKRKIAGDFETMSDRSRKPGMKQAADANAQKYKEQSWKRRHGVEKAIDRLAKEELELDEAFINGREYASHGLMHPDHAASALHKVTGQSIDFYAHGSGDKVSGKVTKNDGKVVHIKDTSGKTHQFKVQRGLPKQQNEEKKEDPPFDGPYKKVAPAKNSDGTTQSSMSRARELAQMAIKKKLKEDIDRLFEAKEKTEYDYEGDMARGQLQSIINNAQKVHDMLKDNDNLPEWVQSKITLAEDYISTVSNYMMSEIDEQAPVAPVPDRKYIKGTPEHKAYKASKKPINGIPTGKYKEDIDFNDEGALMTRTVSYKEFLEINEIKMSDLPSRIVRGHSYGANYSDPEGADDADDKPTKPAAEKRGRGRPAGAQSGARKILGTSKLHTK